MYKMICMQYAHTCMHIHIMYIPLYSTYKKCFQRLLKTSCRKPLYLMTVTDPRNVEVTYMDECSEAKSCN